MPYIIIQIYCSVDKYEQKYMKTMVVWQFIKQKIRITDRNTRTLVTREPRWLLDNRLGYSTTVLVSRQPFWLLDNRFWLLDNRFGYLRTALVTWQPHRLPDNRRWLLDNLFGYSTTVLVTWQPLRRLKDGSFFKNTNNRNYCSVAHNRNKILK